MRNEESKRYAMILGSMMMAGGMLLIMRMSPLPLSSNAQAPPPNRLLLFGVARDVKPVHPDFGIVPSDGYGHYTGMIDTDLGADGRPVFLGEGARIISGAIDVKGTPIAPSMANWTNGLTNFEIVNGHVIPNDRFVAKIDVLGVDIGSIPITLRTTAGYEIYEPFGPDDNPNTSNINDNQNPRVFVFPEEYEAGTHVTVGGFSWMGSSSSSSLRLSANSDDNSNQVIVLRDGDPIPDIEPYPGQLPLIEYIADYADTATNTISIEGHQVIFLYELYTTDMDDPAADFQDMVVLLSLIAPPSGYATDGSIKSCAPRDDIEATLSGTPSTGGIDSFDSFNSWFNDELGVNISERVGIMFNRTETDTFLFDSSTDPPYKQRGGFYPQDNRGFGNDGANGHNQFFTYSFEANFIYDQLAIPFLDLTTNGDVWVYLNDTLMIDLGGIHGVLHQRIELDRLCLNDGETYKISFFYAQRNTLDSDLRIETNLLLTGTGRPVTTMGIYD